MSCLLPVHSCQLYSFPSSAQLCFAGSWTLPATLPRILPTGSLLDPGRGAHWHVSGRWEEERGHGASSLCFRRHAQQRRQQAALGCKGADRSGSCSLECPGAFAVPVATMGGPRADADMDNSKEGTALGHHLGSFFFQW